MPDSQEVDVVARAMCKRRNTKQCAVICLSHFTTSQEPHCPEAPRVFREDAQAAIAALDTHREQQGFRLVPVEPSEEMIVAGENANGCRVVLQIWRAMIEAAPKAGK